MARRRRSAEALGELDDDLVVLASSAIVGTRDVEAGPAPAAEVTGLDGDVGVSSSRSTSARAVCAQWVSRCGFLLRHLIGTVKGFWYWSK